MKSMQLTTIGSSHLNLEDRTERTELDQAPKKAVISDNKVIICTQSEILESQVAGERMYECE
jgi:hypothetical protein